MNLTRGEILVMPAGKEIDQLIQSFVMGGLPLVKTEWIISYIPDYSTDIVDAWKVVEKFGVAEVTKYDSKKWHVCFVHLSNDGDTDINSGGSTFADTAPLAICRAALLAVQSASPTHDLS